MFKELEFLFVIYMDFKLFDELEIVNLIYNYLRECVNY